MANSDWTNAALAVTHNLNTPLIELIVKFFLSSDGTDANAMQPMQATVDGVTDLGFAFFQQSANAITVQTGANGLLVPQSAGNFQTIDNESWFYQVRVYKFT